jgi:hypothetical protein
LLLLLMVRRGRQAPGLLLLLLTACQHRLPLRCCWQRRDLQVLPLLLLLLQLPRLLHLLCRNHHKPVVLQLYAWAACGSKWLMLDAGLSCGGQALWQQHCGVH